MGIGGLVRDGGFYVLFCGEMGECGIAPAVVEAAIIKMETIREPRIVSAY